MRHRSSAILIVTFQLGAASMFSSCTGGNEEPIQNEDGCTEGWHEALMGELPERTGDVACVDAALTGDTVDARCVGTAPMQGQGVDHQSSDPQGGINVELFFENAFNGMPDAEDLSDENGAISGFSAPVCEPVAYRSTGDPDTAMETFSQHKIWPPGDAITQDFRLVQKGSVALVTLGFGVSSEAGMGMVFGKATSCDMDTALTGVQVVLRDGDCKVPDGAESFVGYTSNRLPDPSLRTTSADGFFFALNVPPGSWVLEMYEKDGDKHRLLGSAPVVVKTDAITLVDVIAGRSDGLLMPAECLSCP